MTHRPIKVLEDGTRVYASYHRYKPVPLEERKYKVRKPDDPRAVRWKGEWFLPLDVLDDAERTMPDTRPDDQVIEHMDAGNAGCRCVVCRRPTADYWRRVWRRRNGLPPGPRVPGPVTP